MLKRLVVCSITLVPALTFALVLCISPAAEAAQRSALTQHMSISTQRRPLITAHRGSSATAPENTASSIVQAISDGADFAEIDVQLAADGTVVLYHDASLRDHGLNRTIRELGYRHLSALDIGHRFHRNFAGEKIPSLRDIISIARGRIRLNIELKPFGSPAPLAAAVAHIVADEQFIAHCLITSFDPEAIAHIQRLNPSLKTGLIAASGKAVTPTILHSSIDAISIKSNAVDHHLAKLIRKHGKELHVWTVNSDSEMRRMLLFDVANIITDYPQRLRSLLIPR